MQIENKGIGVEPDTERTGYLSQLNFGSLLFTLRKFPG